MAPNDSFANRRKASEYEHFRREEDAHLTAMRARAVEQRELSRLSVILGFEDVIVLKTVRDLGFTAETAQVLFLVPVVRMAWLEGGVTPEERVAVLTMARRGDITPGSAADRLLTQWLESSPGEAFLHESTLALSRVLEALPVREAEWTCQRIQASCRSIARTSGGLFGWWAISADERRLLDRLAVIF